MRNTLKQAIVLWGMVLLLVLWSVFISPSGVLRWAGAAAIVLAVAALLIYRRRQAWTEMTGDAGLSSLPPETYRQPVVLVCGGLSAHLFTDSPVRQVSVATVRRRAGVNVPWLLWSGLSGSPLPERASSPWFICTGGEVQVATSTENAMPAQWIAQSGVQERSQRLSYLLKAESLMQWLDLNVLAELNGPEAKCPPLAMAVGLVPSLPAVDNNLWQLWITAMCLSATANRQLLRQVGDDLHRFYAVPVEEFITKARHLSVLKDDATMLDGYYREGEPLRLGLGLYPGERIRQPVLRAIRDWRPPERRLDKSAGGRTGEHPGKTGLADPRGRIYRCHRR